jgi:ATP-dependent RNA helicase DHX36
LDEALNPRIKELATNLATAEDEDGNFMASVAEAAEKEEEKALDELDDMRRVFGGMNLKQGTKMTISWTPKESVKASIDVSGAEKLNFESDVLAKALLDTYFGSQPVSPAALQAFEKGFAAL